jgi:hypothetical protein
MRVPETADGWAYEWLVRLRPVPLGPGAMRARQPIPGEK